MHILLVIITLLGSPNLVFGDVAQCVLSPRGSTRDFIVKCPSGKVKTALNQEKSIKTHESFKLKFNTNIFNTTKIIHIHDSNNIEVFSIRVSSPHVATLRALASDKTWILLGLGSSKLDELFISAPAGKVIIDDALEAEHKFEIDSEELYLTEPFSVKNGTFLLKYRRGFIARLNLPFQTEVDKKHAVLSSLSTSLSPSKRRVPLSSISHHEYDIATSDLVKAYEHIFKKTIEKSYPKYKNITSDKEKRDYLSRYVFNNITDNKKKGELGEYIYNNHLANMRKNYKFKDPKVGLNSFDAVHIRKDVKIIKKIIISEVKYAKNGLPVLGTRKINNQDWRQLSLPYVHSVLADMQSHNKNTQALSQLIKNNLDKIKLNLGVFNPTNLKLIIYDIGTSKKSLMD
jgi:hypothetical protein